MRFETENMDAHERNTISVPELTMSMGQGWGLLKKN
jgi:hypothetical protein